MRTFIAVGFPQEFIEKIERIVTFLKNQTPDEMIKWVEPGKLHLTIKFIGEISNPKLSEVKTILQEKLGSHPPFQISVQGLGMYPNPKYPRVIWLGINNAEPMIKVHKALDQSLKSVGVKSDQRNYSPHLTIGRVRRGTATDSVREIGETLSQFKIENLGNIKIEEIKLYQSELTSKGPIYTQLLSVPLNKV